MSGLTREGEVNNLLKTTHGRSRNYIFSVGNKMLRKLLPQDMWELFIMDIC